jgi:K+-sensing histidine kinase KdpD
MFKRIRERYKVTYDGLMTTAIAFLVYNFFLLGYSPIPSVRVICASQLICVFMLAFGWVPDKKLDSSRRNKASKCSKKQLKRQFWERMKKLRGMIANQRVVMFQLGFLECAKAFLEFLFGVFLTLFGYTM